MWTRLDDRFMHHPKILKAGVRASYLFVAGLIYCAAYRTDGFIPKEALPILAPLRDYKKLARKLVDVRVPWSEHGLWEEVEGGYRIHDYHDFQPSAAELRKREEADRARLRAVRSGPASMPPPFEEGPAPARASAPPAAEPSTSAPSTSAPSTNAQPEPNDGVVTTSSRRRRVPTPSPIPIPNQDRYQDHPLVCAPDPRARERDEEHTHKGATEIKNDREKKAAPRPILDDADAAAVLDLLRSMPEPIAHLATLEHARRFAAAKLTGLALDDVLRAITAAGLKLGAHAHAAADDPRALAALADHVGTFLAHQSPRVSSPSASASARAEPSKDAIDRFLSRWSELYGKAESSIYTPTGEDRTHAEALVTLIQSTAADHAARSNMPENEAEAQITEHWIRAYFRDEGVNGYLDKARHPLRYMLRQVSTYGLPRAARSGPVKVRAPKSIEPAMSASDHIALGRELEMALAAKIGAGPAEGAPLMRRAS